MYYLWKEDMFEDLKWGYVIGICSFKLIFGDGLKCVMEGFCKIGFINKG